MGSTNWVVELLKKALETWNDKMTEIWQLLTTSPKEFKGGGIWSVITNIHGGLQAVGYALLVLFFVVGVVRTTTSFAEIKRPEQAFKLFIRFAAARALITYGMELLLAVSDIAQGVVTRISGSAGNVLTAGAALPDEIQQKILACGFLESIPLMLVALLFIVLVTVLSFVMILTVYSRFFTLYMYTAVAPLPLATFAAEGSSAVGGHFVKSFAGVCLQGAVIALACIIYSVFARSMPLNYDANTSAVNMVWCYMGELCFNLLVLVGTVKTSERVIKDMIGF